MIDRFGRLALMQDTHADEGIMDTETRRVGSMSHTPSKGKS